MRRKIIKISDKECMRVKMIKIKMGGIRVHEKRDNKY